MNPGVTTSMAKQRDMRLHSDNPDELNRLREEYEFIGRRARVENGVLIVSSLPKTWKRKRDKERRLAAARADRSGEDSDTSEYRDR